MFTSGLMMGVHSGKNCYVVSCQSGGHTDLCMPEKDLGQNPRGVRGSLIDLFLLDNAFFFILKTEYSVLLTYLNDLNLVLLIHNIRLDLTGSLLCFGSRCCLGRCILAHCFQWFFYIYVEEKSVLCFFLIQDSFKAKNLQV